MSTFQEKLENTGYTIDNLTKYSENRLLAVLKLCSDRSIRKSSPENYRQLTSISPSKTYTLVIDHITPIITKLSPQADSNI
jgi:hypothetical protein